MHVIYKHTSIRVSLIYVYKHFDEIFQVNITTSKTKAYCFKTATILCLMILFVMVCQGCLVSLQGCLEIHLRWLKFLGAEISRDQIIVFPCPSPQNLSVSPGWASMQHGSFREGSVLIATWSVKEEAPKQSSQPESLESFHIKKSLLPYNIEAAN